ncbi:plasmid pRiA4b ORF-3 family protein [Parvicella tangerina]|uniref:Plasmid pRiA4b Orf3-like domain-containing protein n=1 Tax=Parvicella tangerina TaxID=2829795 RepID=A0A916JL50_9FLAO|nr:plasmid pRiA4b ORF-3 family protein [Parvicella tangerina]CAG5076965.1 hypothetical protein CRYO30217_00258 [Parvicella tangerina]
MKTLVLRIVIDTEEDIFRDIEIRQDQNFEELHDAIIQSFQFSGDQMASFYMSNDDWEKGQEIGLMDVSAFDGDNSTPSMKTTLIEQMLNKKHQKMLYVYDFLKMWIFYVEVIQINDADGAQSYPKMVRKFGDAPNEDSKELPDLFEGLDVHVQDDFGSSDDDDDYDDFDDDDPFSEFEDSYDY